MEGRDPRRRRAPTSSSSADSNTLKYFLGQSASLDPTNEHPYVPFASLLTAANQAYAADALSRLRSSMPGIGTVAAALATPMAATMAAMAPTPSSSSSSSSASLTVSTRPNAHDPGFIGALARMAGAVAAPAVAAAAVVAAPAAAAAAAAPREIRYKGVSVRAGSRVAIYNNRPTTINTQGISMRDPNDPSQRSLAIIAYDRWPATIYPLRLFDRKVYHQAKTRSMPVLLVKIPTEGVSFFTKKKIENINIILRHDFILVNRERKLVVQFGLEHDQEEPFAPLADEFHKNFWHEGDEGIKLFKMQESESIASHISSLMKAASARRAEVPVPPPEAVAAAARAGAFVPNRLNARNVPPPAAAAAAAAAVAAPAWTQIGRDPRDGQQAAAASTRVTFPRWSPERRQQAVNAAVAAVAVAPAAAVALAAAPVVAAAAAIGDRPMPPPTLQRSPAEAARRVPPASNLEED